MVKLKVFVMKSSIIKKVFYLNCSCFVVLVSGVYSKVILFIYTCVYIYIIFLYGLLQNTEGSLLCYTLDPYCLFVLYIVVCIC